MFSDTITWEPVYTEGFEDALPRSRAGHASAVVNSRLYIISGRDGYHRAYNNQVLYHNNHICVLRVFSVRYHFTHFRSKF